MCVVPVKFTSVGVNVSGNKTTIRWTTGEEINNKEFVVERSQDNYLWTNVATVNPNSYHEYEVYDNYAGKTYYRIKQVDKDGGKNYSKIMYLKDNSVDKAIKVYPTAFTTDFNVRIYSDKRELYRIGMYTANGILVSAVSCGVIRGTNIIKYPIDSMKTGVYIIRITGVDRDESFRVIKSF